VKDLMELAVAVNRKVEVWWNRVDDRNLIDRDNNGEFVKDSVSNFERTVDDVERDGDVIEICGDSKSI
jgi:hypothetical protein